VAKVYLATHGKTWYQRVFKCISYQKYKQLHC